MLGGIPVRVMQSFYRCARFSPYWFCISRDKTLIHRLNGKRAKISGHESVFHFVITSALVLSRSAPPCPALSRSVPLDANEKI